MPVTFKLLTGLMDELISPLFPKATYDAQSGMFVGEGPVPQINNWLGAVLAQEPVDDPNDLTSRGPVTRWIGYAFGNPRMTRAQAMAILPIQPGDPNPFFTIIDAVRREGATISIGAAFDAFSTAGPIYREEWLRTAYATLVVMSGGDVTGMKAFFELTEAQLSEPVPESFPNRTITTRDPQDPEAEPVVTVHTWQSWGVPVDPEEAINGKHYKSNQDLANRSIQLPASIWITAGVPVLSVAEWKSLKASQSLTPTP